MTLNDSDYQHAGNVYSLSQIANKLREHPRTEADARREKAETEFLALKLVIDVETDRLTKWHDANYRSDKQAMEYAGKVMAAFGRIVEARRRSVP